MSKTTRNEFAKWIIECRENLERSREGILFKLGLKKPNGDADGVAGCLKQHYQQLAEKGRVVWGAVSQVNMHMFSLGQIDLPGVTAYSLDAYYDSQPQDLRITGRACFQFKNTLPSDVEYREIASRLTDEFDSTPRLDVPRSLSEGRDVFLGATMFHRARLPNRVLLASVFPLVVAPHLTEINMVLPLALWAVPLRQAWENLDHLLEQTPIRSTAMNVANRAEKRAIDLREPTWDVHSIPVLITPDMVAHLKDQSHQVGWETLPFLAIGLNPDGMKTADLILHYDQKTNVMFHSNGVNVVIRTDQLEQLRGTIVDFKSSTFETGVIIRLRGE